MQLAVWLMQHLQKNEQTKWKLAKLPICTSFIMWITVDTEWFVWTLWCDNIEIYGCASDTLPESIQKLAALILHYIVTVPQQWAVWMYTMIDHPIQKLPSTYSGFSSGLILAISSNSVCMITLHPFHGAFNLGSIRVEPGLNTFTCVWLIWNCIRVETTSGGSFNPDWTGINPWIMLAM